MKAFLVICAGALVGIIATTATLDAVPRGFKCTLCNGSGWYQGFQCPRCGGDGTVGN